MGIASINNLCQTETHKRRKYDPPANELANSYKYAVNVIPFVITWDGVVTKYNKRFYTLIGINNKVLAYTQITSLKKTMESLSMNLRRGFGDIEFAEGNQSDYNA